MVPEGVQCISLGPQTPLEDIRRAAIAHKAHIVALSFSAAFPLRQATDGLAALRRELPAHVDALGGRRNDAPRAQDAARRRADPRSRVDDRRAAQLAASARGGAHFQKIDSDPIFVQCGSPSTSVSPSRSASRRTSPSLRTRWRTAPRSGHSSSACRSTTLRFRCSSRACGYSWVGIGTDRALPKPSSPSRQRAAAVLGRVPGHRPGAEDDCVRLADARPVAGTGGPARPAAPWHRLQRRGVDERAPLPGGAATGPRLCAVVRTAVRLDRVVRAAGRGQDRADQGRHRRAAGRDRRRTAWAASSTRATCADTAARTCGAWSRIGTPYGGSKHA